MTRAFGHDFADAGLLREALTHRSAGRGATVSNERLEFLGDRVLGLLIAEWISQLHPTEPEGALGRRLAALVSMPACARVARAQAVGERLIVSDGEARAGVLAHDTVLSDALEAVIGALYIDGGIGAARGFVRRAWAEAVAAQEAPPRDAKSALQEYVQSHTGALPEYAVAAQEGPSHAPSFTIAVRALGREARAVGANKRAAEQAAAAALLAELSA